MSESGPIRIVIVDDHSLVRDGLRLLLATFDDMEVVALAQNGKEATTLCSELQPDVVLMDLVMPEGDGPTAIKAIRTLLPATQVIALTSFMDEDLMQRALQAGAIGFLLKNISADQLASAIRGAAHGQTTIDAAAVAALVQAAYGPQPVGHDLTDRERDVLRLLAMGKTNSEIARSLSLSTGTVRVYVSNILAKLGVANRTEAAALALQHHLFRPDPVSDALNK